MKLSGFRRWEPVRQGKKKTDLSGTVPRPDLIHSHLRCRRLLIYKRPPLRLTLQTAQLRADEAAAVRGNIRCL